MNLYIMLHQDHEKAKNLFEQLEAAGEDEESLRERLFASLVRELELHAEAEERYFYNRLKVNDSARRIALESLDDHNAMKRLLLELDAMDKGTPGWTRKFRGLRTEVEGHILREEEELFPMAQKVIGEEEAAGIAEDIETWKEARAEVEFW